MIGYASVRDGGLSALDVALAESFASIWPDADESALILAALTSWAVSQAHSCFAMELIAPASDASASAASTASEKISAAAMPGDDRRVARVLAELRDGRWPQAPFIGGADDDTPLVRYGERVWLRRYWRYEREIEVALRARACDIALPEDVAVVRRELDRLLPPVDSIDTDWQRVAAVLAMRSRLTVICGGPGTGKTFTVLRVLALLHRFSATPLRIALAAPTGKAAQRLSESMRGGLASPALSASEREALPSEAMTLHRLLGFRPQSVQPARDDNRPLDLDVLVVDECSMVDLPLMAKLLRALKPQTRLILLGDPDQLPAVENGAVLATLAACNPDNTFAAGARAWIATSAGADVPGNQRIGAIAATVVRLERPRRFGGESGIARLVRAVRSADAQSVFDALDAGGDVHWSEQPLRNDSAAAVAHLRSAHAALLDARSPEQALAALARYRVLCALRQGVHGVVGLNAIIAEALHGSRGSSPYHAGRPILVTSNDAALGLFNGDVGVMFAEREGAPVRAWFMRSDGSAHAFAPAQLPPHESAYAMTVHKAQGSEFDRVELVLPPEAHPLLTREWLYTAVSRARTRLDVRATQSAMIAALGSGARRINGLQLE